MTALQTSTPRLGLRANAGQFALLVGVNGLVGAMLGQERTILPLIADTVFGLTGFTVILAFVLAFGVTKAIANLAAGALADWYGRKPVLVAGWLLGVPVPLLLIWAPSWAWVIVANVFLGLNQGFAWSSTVIMKIDLVGPARRGLAMGLNEAAGYLAVALTALATGFIAAEAGLRPAPFFLGLVVAGLDSACRCYPSRDARPCRPRGERERRGPAMARRLRHGPPTAIRPSRRRRKPDS